MFVEEVVAVVLVEVIEKSGVIPNHPLCSCQPYSSVIASNDGGRVLQPSDYKTKLDRDDGATKTAKQCLNCRV